MSGKGGEEPRGHRAATIGIHAGSPEPVLGAPVVSPVVQSSTFIGGAGEPASELLYSRYGNNPNQVLVGEKMAALEGTEASLLLASGMSAIAMTIFAALPEGGHVVASRHLYGATRTLLEQELPRRGITTTLIDPESSEDWEAALTPQTGVLLLEVPANPTLRVFDLRVPAEIARDSEILLAVDGTFASPANIRFAELGVGAVVHSATKYLGGHSDLVGGVVSGSREFIERVQNLMKLYGPAPDPHMAWLLDRGLKTLQMRVAQHNHNAMELARWFLDREGVVEVHYPGLPDHPDHAVASEIMSGFGGMLAIVLEGGGVAADAFTSTLELALVAPSLGGVETLVSQPRHTSHIHFSEAMRVGIGIPDGFVRISVGLEDVEDLKEDFGRALDGLR
ncbi:MAG: aminotransferase class I/II-fold pyridoxal phosphate-dependent enzyme [Gemmatimonadetes bacterium]|nr:aminotransferase class I/II-fold pyridoxal phosphate-dependent enzyme [Gemmatimonadota bacterium]MCH8811633.1 aminotransferase class I/II-fold pyridoxal phosphate-dependent enzyme [Gemmatimonadota bacterium]